MEDQPNNLDQLGPLICQYWSNSLRCAQTLGSLQTSTGVQWRRILGPVFEDLRLRNALEFQELPQHSEARILKHSEVQILFSFSKIVILFSYLFHVFPHFFPIKNRSHKKYVLRGRLVLASQFLEDLDARFVGRSNPVEEDLWDYLAPGMEHWKSESWNLQTANWKDQLSFSGWKDQPFLWESKFGLHTDTQLGLRCRTT